MGFASALPILRPCRRTISFSRRISPELCLVTPPSKPRGRREGRVLTSHPRSAARKVAQRRPHSSIQVVPITRPSLRDGRTAYAALSREPNSLWPPSSLRKSPAPRRLTRLPHSQALDRSDDGQDHTVLPYARPAISPQFFQPCRRSRKLAGETKPSSAAHPARSLGLTESNPPCPDLSRPTPPRPPQPGSRIVTTHDRPSRMSRDGQYIRSFRISVKRNIFARAA
ncbi:hypothetical protein M2191_004079 [Bradyrhizobium japonicum]|nr:hypothetical protein [Bradyrhizobium japonicum]